MLAQAQSNPLTINPAPVSGENTITSSQTYLYITNNSANSVQANLGLTNNSAGITIGSNRCGSEFKPFKTCYIIISFPNYGKLANQVSVSLKNTFSEDNILFLTVLKYTPPVLNQYSSFSTSSINMNDFINHSISITNRTLTTRSYSPTFSGLNPSNFSIALNRCQNIPPKGKCDLIIKQSAQYPGSYSAVMSEPQIDNSLYLFSSITSATVGALIPPNPSITASPSFIDFGTLTTLNRTASQNITLTNNGNVAISPITGVVGDGLQISLNRCLTVLLPGQSCAVSVQFAPNSSMSNGLQLLSFNAQATSLTPIVSVPVLVNLNVASILSIAENASISTGGGESSDFYIKRVALGTFAYNNVSNKFYSWGMNFQSGYTVGHEQLTPLALDITATLSGKTLKKIATGQNHACAIASDDKAYCWGHNEGGQLGIGTYMIQSSINPLPVDTTGVLAGKTIKQISVGPGHTCVIASDNKPYCWGNNYNGQLGNGSAGASIEYSPVAVDMTGVLAGKLIKQLNTEEYSSCVIASDNKVYCWGFGYLGNGIDYPNTNQWATSPVAVNWNGVLSGKTAKYLTTSTYVSCIIANDNKAYCWGYNGSGQLGDGTSNDSLVPVAVDASGALAGKNIETIIAGGLATFALTTDGKVYSWGSNWHGTMGINDLQLDNLPPTEIYMGGELSGKTIKALSSSIVENYSCVIASDDKAYCWGTNNYGNLGTNISPLTTQYELAPKAVYTGGVLAGKIIKSLSIERIGTTCVTSSENNAYCWGNNNYGQVGDGTKIQRIAPVFIPLP